MSIRKLCLTSTILITGLSVSGCANVLDPISTSFNQLTGQNSAAPAAKKKPAVAQKTSKKKVAAVRKKAPVKTPTVAAKLPVPAAKPAQAPKVLKIDAYDEDLFGGEGGGEGGGGGGGGWG